MIPKKQRQSIASASFFCICAILITSRSTLSFHIHYSKEPPSQRLIPTNYFPKIMADIALGQSINGSLTPDDSKFTGDPFTVFDRYTITGLDDYRQISLNFTNANTITPLNMSLRDVNTGTIIASSEATFGGGKLSLRQTTYPGVKYEVLVSGLSGNYTLSTTDGGKATSIISANPAPLEPLQRGVIGAGTFGADGKFFPLATSNLFSLSDLTLAANGQSYGIKSGKDFNLLYRIDPKLTVASQISEAGGAAISSFIKDAQGDPLKGTIDAIEFAGDTLYALAGTTTGDKLYTIDPSNRVAILVGDLPSGLLNKGGDLVYDPTNSRFLVTAEGTPGNDALWQIPLTNPAGATKIGQIGFRDVTAINFENGQLTGISKKADGTATKITINPSTGSGTLGQAISGVIGISGSTTIVGENATNPNIPNTPISTPTTQNPFPTSAAGAIGTKSQGLAEGRIIDLTDFANQALKADITTKGDAAYINNIGFYTVKDALTGAIDIGNGNTVKPGDADYAKAAVTSAIANSLQLGKNDRKSNLDVPGGGVYAPIVIAQGSLADFANKNSSNGGDGSKIHAYFNYLGANPDKFDHFRLTSPNTFAVEDQYGGGDKDFNDLVVNMNVRTA
jgi:Domain of unknown function (DUF4114)